MEARAALFDLYAEHLRPRTDQYAAQAPVAALVRLLAPLGIAEPAVRTAVSRMTHQGWLRPTRIDDAPAYALTARAEQRLDEGASRLAAAGRDEPWDGYWHLLLLTPPMARSARERLATGLRFLGYGSLSESARSSTWLAARPSAEVDSLLATEGARAERFHARHDGDSVTLVARAWDTEALVRAYHHFLDHGQSLAGGSGRSDEDRYSRRVALGHEWRRFLVLDPRLPRELLPLDWPGVKAAEWFHAEAAQLLPPARRFVESCLTSVVPGPAPGPVAHLEPAPAPAPAPVAHLAPAPAPPGPGSAGRSW